MVSINLREIHDDLEGNWWLYIRSADFGFKEHISLKEMGSFEAADGDVFIHKFKAEGERFPQVRYHLIQDELALQLEGKRIREHLARKLIEYVTANHKLPFGCSLSKEFKNNSAQVDYHPAEFENFALRIEPEMMDPSALKGLPVEPTNPLADPSMSNQIQPIPNALDLEKIAAEDPKGKSSVCIFNAEVVNLEKRESTFQEHVNIFYLVQIKGGEAAPDTKKSTLHRPFEKINIKISDSLKDKVDLKPGDRITFNGKLKKDKKGVLLQNIVKITKES